MPLLGLVGEAHELPNQGFVDPVTLHYLRVDVERQARIGVARLAHRPTRVAAGGERETREGATQGVRRDLLVHAALMVGRRERGRTRLRVAGAIGHAINFHTWHSLVREQQLSVDEAITLMTATVQAAGQPTPGPPRQPRSATERSRSSAHARAK